VLLVDPSLKIASPVKIKTSQLIVDIGYLLAGIPSSTFHFCTDDQSFSIVPGICIFSVSPECLSSFCELYLKIGTTVRRIMNLSSDSNHYGSVYHGFRNGIRSFLRLYCNSVITISNEGILSLSEFEQKLRPFVNQISFLGSVCAPDSFPPNESFSSTGVSLLSKLLDFSIRSSNKLVHLLLVSLLNSSSASYFKFLKLWLFSGEVECCPQEFGLDIDNRYINARDINFWQSAYNLIPLEGSSFLAEIQQKVHLTGKSLALLKLICPDHFLAGKFRNLQPVIKLSVSAADQIELKNACATYEEEMLGIAKELSDNLEEMKVKKEAERLKIAQEVYNKNKEVELRLKEKSDKERELKIIRQAKQREDIENQIKDVNARKVREKEEQIKAEKLIEVEAKRIEENRIKHEQEERKRVEEFYAKLSAEAELRERRAEWRMRRCDPQLKTKRIVLNRELDSSNANMKRNIKAPVDKFTPSKGVDNLDYSSLQFKSDAEGNLLIMANDQEGNLIYEDISSFSDISQKIQNHLHNDNCDSLNEATKEEICKLVFNSKSAGQSIKGSASPFGQIHSRFQNKAMVLGSNIPMHYDDGITNKEYDLNDNNGNLHTDTTDATPRKKSSNSQPIERLLYPHRYYEMPPDAFTPLKTDLVLNYSDNPTPYVKHFPYFNSPIFHEMGGPSPVVTPADGQAFAPLTLIFQNSILVPLRVQARLVNSALLNHLLIDRKLFDHFQAMRRYLFLADGEFGRQLVLSLCKLGHTMDQPSIAADQLYSHYRAGAPPPIFLSPASLNRVLDSALAGSVSGSVDPLSAHLTFLLDQETGTRTLGIPGLSLTYQAGWPLNIVLTQETVAKYSTILDFMVELRLAMVALELDWATENLVLRRDKKTDTIILHKINLMRHEMLNFLRNLHAYVACQVLEVSWIEFQENLANRVSCLDDLISIHEKYLQRAMFRCLLNPKAAPVMKIITDIFSSITRFSGLVGSRFNGDSAENWSNIQKQYLVFKQYSKFLFNLVSKLSARGYQPHFQDLLLRLNFNDFYVKR